MFQYSVPSKTFIVGEYGVLVDGPAIVACTEPRFKLRKAQSPSEKSFDSFSPLSPAGRLMACHSEISWKDYFFDDPHQGRGGFGASSAQFIFVNKIIENHCKPASAEVNRRTGVQDFEVWKKFRDLENAEGKDALDCMRPEDSFIKPSGVDLLAQLTGGLAIVDIKTQSAKSLDWPFRNLSFLIFRTGIKVETHAHFNKVSKDSCARLANIAVFAIEAFQRTDSLEFLKAISEFDSVMIGQCLYSVDSETRWQSLRTHKDVLAVKGCGAMGADTVIVFCESSTASSLREFIANKLKLEFVTNSSELAQGFLKEKQIGF